MRQALPIATAITILTLASAVPAAEIVTLNEKNWDEYAPKGKEVDCIYGDIVMRNDKIVVVIGKPVPSRNANMTVKNVGGCIIDLTTRDNPNDQLSAYYPGGGESQYEFNTIGAGAEKPTTEGNTLETLSANGDSATIQFRAKSVPGKPDVFVRYELKDGDEFVTVSSKFGNTSEKSIKVVLEDRVRADKSFQSGVDGATNLAWYYDEWFDQAYGIVPVDAKIRYSPPQKTKEGKPLPPLLQFVVDGLTSVELDPEKSIELERRVYPARNLLDVRTVANRWAKLNSLEASVRAKDAGGLIPNARVTLLKDKEVYGWGRTDALGILQFSLPKDKWRVRVEPPNRNHSQEVGPFDLAPNASDFNLTTDHPQAGVVVAKITNESGGPTPCKVQFRGRLPPKPVSVDDKAPPDPDFGPDSGEHAVKNLYYSHTGTFRQEIAAGMYDVIISYGPEHDAIFTDITVERGKETKLEATLKRVVQTPGWISSDFHSHSTPSGDNTSSQLGRVLNLICEHVEFAPCTEHNRISSYEPHLKHLKAEHLLATCTGIELTGSLLPVNHQNAFPLKEKPRTQDGGGPQVENENPVAQIERLALWDGNSDKLVQMDHPDLPRILGDRDNDGKPDPGFEKMFGYVDVMEVHPLHEIFETPTSLEENRKASKTIFHWMQMLNLGYRIPGVVNTDAHYNFHGSGFLRNYIKCPTDDPAKIGTLDIVHASEHGWVVMTSGPFMEVSLAAGERKKGPGDSIAAPDGKGKLRVRVQCPNWLDIDRVQVFVNGRAEKALNFTRRENGKMFGREVVRFDQEIPLELKSDAHVIVAAVGENSTLGVVMGPEYGKHKPIAVSNPIFVDVDGKGFQPNGDLLGLPIHVQKPGTTHRHGHEHDHEH